MRKILMVSILLGSVGAACAQSPVVAPDPAPLNTNDPAVVAYALQGVADDGSVRVMYTESGAVYIFAKVGGADLVGGGSDLLMALERFRSSLRSSSGSTKSAAEAVNALIHQNAASQ